MQITVYTSMQTVQIGSVTDTAEERNGGWEDVCVACLYVCLVCVCVCVGSDLFAWLFDPKY